jgi:hypothetical protein
VILTTLNTVPICFRVETRYNADWNDVDLTTYYVRNIVTSKQSHIIESLKSSHTHGYDEISNIILKACKAFISVPLSYLCNRVLFEGIFPDRQKYVTIAPVY